MKKMILSVLLISTLLIGLTGCGSSTAENNKANDEKGSYTEEKIQIATEIGQLYELRGKVENAVSDQEARKIAGNDDKFPLSVDYLEDNEISKQEIIELINSLIETEEEIVDKINEM